MDGSTGAAAAARAAAARAWPAGSEVRLIAVYDTFAPSLAGNFIPSVVHWVEEDNRAAAANALKMVELFEEQFYSAKLATSHVVKPGDPKKVILREAENWEADCIFIGARGLSRIDRFLLGSVSAAVAARAHCSVEIVRPKPEPDVETSQNRQ
jgi:nucleotide-binding universal stress UspA family protein